MVATVTAVTTMEAGDTVDGETVAGGMVVTAIGEMADGATVTGAIIIGVTVVGTMATGGTTTADIIGRPIHDDNPGNIAFQRKTSLKTFG